MKALPILLLSAGLALNAAGVMAQEGQGAANEGDKYWSTECTGPKRSLDGLSCTAVQNIHVANTGALLFQVKIVVPADSDDTPAMSLQGPHNVFLPGGYTLSVDGAALAKVTVRNCNAQGCFGVVRLEPAMIDTLKRGNNLRITFLATPEAQQFVETPLAGFTRAMTAIE